MQTTMHLNPSNLQMETASIYCDWACLSPQRPFGFFSVSRSFLDRMRQMAICMVFETRVTMRLCDPTEYILQDWYQCFWADVV